MLRNRSATGQGLVIVRWQRQCLAIAALLTTFPFGALTAAIPATIAHRRCMEGSTRRVREIVKLFPVIICLMV